MSCLAGEGLKSFCSLLKKGLLTTDDSDEISTLIFSENKKV